MVVLVSGASLMAQEDADDIFFALPSPNEILVETERQGLSIEITRENSKVLKTDFGKLAEESPAKTAFIMGRIFAIAGFKFKELNNANLLGLAGKIYKGTQSLDLPEIVRVELDTQYRKMLDNPKWERDELMIAFTAARSSLMFLLKGTDKIDKDVKPRVEALGASLELGIWFESLYLALEKLEQSQLDAYYDVFLMDDVLEYFDRGLKKALVGVPDENFYTVLKKVNDETLAVIEDGKLNQEECESLKKSLAALID